MSSAAIGNHNQAATLTIDIGALVANWRLLRERAAGGECAAVVKADAYGTGLEEAGAALHEAGCRTFFVAHFCEGMRLRNVTGAATIYILNGLLPGQAEAYAPSELRPVLGSMEEIADWARFCRDAGRRLPAAIHVDTGMNRLGLSLDQARALSSDPVLTAFEPALVMSHLVTAEIRADPVNAHQIADLTSLRRAFPESGFSLANSSGLFLPDAPVLDLARPGYALYGGNPIPGVSNPMHPVVRLEASILQVREVEAGEHVGYNGTWTAPSRRRLATLSIGYADGFPRNASASDETRARSIPAGEAIVAGQRCAFAGRVSMDLLTIDVSDVAGPAPKRGDSVTLIGDDLTIDEVGARSGTIGYEILTRLGPRYRRVYLKG